MTQQVEYEWKPPFCTKCNKVGHICKQKFEKPKKIYAKKQVATSNDVISVTDQESQQDKKGAAEEEEPWIKVKTASRNRGKGPIETKNVDCNMGFDILTQGECSNLFLVP